MEVDLTRSDIINLLKKRHLPLNYLESLSQGQLEKLYQEFAVPRPRRQPRKRPAPADSPTREVERLTQRLKMTSMASSSPPDYKKS